jgi:phytoene dehydrogenase-like protein
MTGDVIVIGAGIGGLSCAAKLARNGRKVLVLEKDRHIGGTSYIFKRDGYSFPMGPLSFSFPNYVRSFLSEVGVEQLITFKRNHFQLIAPSLDIIYSLPLDAVKENLKRVFVDQSEGLDAFFPELEQLISLTSDIHLWHPAYQLGNKKDKQGLGGHIDRSKVDHIGEISRTPGRDMLDRYFSDQRLINFLGSLGTSKPEMSLLNLAFMWNVMSREGIWSPSCGIHGLSELLAEIVFQCGGEIKLSTPAEAILIREGKAVGVKDVRGETYLSEWVVSNVDFKRTFLDLVNSGDIPRESEGILDSMAHVPYTGSELCVYLGIDPRAVDFGRMNAAHLFFRQRQETGKNRPEDLEDFENREVEICSWSENEPGLAPHGKAGLVLRVNFPYDYFSRFRAGEKKRRQDYRSYKMQLSQKLIKAAENILPGLSCAIEVREAATPLTYEDWGHRYRGSIAGWTWRAGYEKALGTKLLIETPVRNLLLAGIYAASELFLGGIPTAIYTANLAAEIILA